MQYVATTGSTLPSLTVKGLACERDDRFLFQNLDFELASGGLLLVEGSNGSGKTSLLRILTGLRRQERGAVFWQGVDIRNLNGEYQQQLLYIGHSNGLKTELTVHENLQQYLTFGAVNGVDVGAVLAGIGLERNGEDPVGRLSAGQQRRVALSRLIFSSAPLWILDEPFTSLDRQGVRWIESLITCQLDAGGMVILSSHQELGLVRSRVDYLRLSS